MLWVKGLMDVEYIYGPVRYDFDAGKGIIGIIVHHNLHLRRIRIDTVPFKHSTFSCNVMLGMAYLVKIIF